MAHYNLHANDSKYITIDTIQQNESMDTSISRRRRRTSSSGTKLEFTKNIDSAIAVGNTHTQS